MEELINELVDVIDLLVVGPGKADLKDRLLKKLAYRKFYYLHQDYETPEKIYASFEDATEARLDQKYPGDWYIEEAILC